MAKKKVSAPQKYAKSTSVKKPKAKIVIKSSSKKNEKKPPASQTVATPSKAKVVATPSKPAAKPVSKPVVEVPKTPIKEAQKQVIQTSPTKIANKREEKTTTKKLVRSKIERVKSPASSFKFSSSLTIAEMRKLLELHDQTFGKKGKRVSVPPSPEKRRKQ